MTQLKLPTGKSGTATLYLNSIMPSMLSAYIAYDNYPKMSATHTLTAKLSAFTYTPYTTGDEFRVETEMLGVTVKAIYVWVKYKGQIWYHARYKRNGELLEVLQDNRNKNQAT